MKVCLKCSFILSCSCSRHVIYRRVYRFVSFIYEKSNAWHKNGFVMHTDKILWSRWDNTSIHGMCSGHGMSHSTSKREGRVDEALIFWKTWRMRNVGTVSPWKCYRHRSRRWNVGRTDKNIWICGVEAWHNVGRDYGSDMIEQLWTWRNGHRWPATASWLHPYYTFPPKPFHHRRPV